MPGYPYGMASASASVQFPMPHTGPGPLHAIWESDTASIHPDLPNPYDSFQRIPDSQQQPAGSAHQATPRAPPALSSSRPHRYYAASPHHVAGPTPGPSIRQPRSMADMGAYPGRKSSSSAGDYFSHMPSVPFAQPQRAPQLRHVQSSPPPIPHRPYLSQPPVPPRPAHSFPAPVGPHNGPYVHGYPASQSFGHHAVPHPSSAGPMPPHVSLHPHHTPPTPSRHHYVGSAPAITPSGSPKPNLPPKPQANDDEFRRAVQASLHESRMPSAHEEDAALAQALRQSLVDVGRPHSSPQRAPSSIATSSSGHSTESGSGVSSSRMSSPYASPRPPSSVPHPAFFPTHRARGSSAAATPTTSPQIGTPGSVIDTAQALRMRSTLTETLLPRDIRQRSESANKDKFPNSAPSSSGAPNASPGGQARLTKRTARSQSDLGHSPQAGRRLSVAVEPTPVEPVRADEPELTAILNAPVVESPSPRQQEFHANDAPPSYPFPGSGMVDEKHGPHSGVSTEESDSSRMSNAQQQMVPQELLTGMSMGFGTAPIVSTEEPFQGMIPTLISLPYGDKAPFYIQGPNWRSILKFLARLPATRVEPSIDALKRLKGEARLRIVVSFVKVYSTSSEWLTGVYMSIDVPVPVNAPNAARFRNGDSSVVPWSYTISAAPSVMRDGAEGPLSKYYTIPSVPGNLYPTLPVTFPDIAMYLASALELSRGGPPEGYPGLRRLSKLVDTLYPGERGDGLEADEKPGMRQKLKSFVGLGSKPQRSRNAEMYDLVTPFVPDDYGR